MRDEMMTGLHPVQPFECFPSADWRFAFAELTVEKASAFDRHGIF
jgi:hypothetical protein